MTISLEDNRYISINTYFINDKRLSPKARGLLVYAFSRPVGWEFSIADFIRNCSGGKCSITHGLKELQDTGYLVKNQPKVNGSRYGKSEWTFYETPINKGGE